MIETSITPTTNQNIADLADAVWQALDDFQGGTSCCVATKAQLRFRFEPFMTAGDREAMNGIMTLSEAEAILREVGML